MKGNKCVVTVDLTAMSSAAHFSAIHLLHFAQAAESLRAFDFKLKNNAP